MTAPDCSFNGNGYALTDSSVPVINTIKCYSRDTCPKQAVAIYKGRNRMCQSTWLLRVAKTKKQETLEIISRDVIMSNPYPST